MLQTLLVGGGAVRNVTNSGSRVYNITNCASGRGSNITNSASGGGGLIHYTT